MVFKCLPTGMLSSNCYIIGDNNEGAVIDPGCSAQEIMNALENAGLEAKYIILTHAHFDHMCSMDEVRDKTGAKVAVHESDAPALMDSFFNGSVLFGLERRFKAADVLLKDGDVINVGGVKLTIMHTPGHTPGSICIEAQDRVFTGDTLFRMSVGRTDLGNGSYEDLMTSLTKKLMSLDDKTVVYPGHGAASTIGHERKYNPYF